MMKLSLEEGFVRRWFQANSLTIAIDTDKHNPEMCAASDAVLLDENALLLHALAVVKGADSTWFPTAQNPSEELTHTLTLKEDAAVQLGLICGEALPMVSEAQDWIEIVAHEQLYNFSLEPFILSEKEYATISEAGSLLLIPSTFDDIVPGYVGTDSHSYKANVVKQAGRTDVDIAQKLTNTPKTAASSGHVCEIVLDKQIPIDARQTEQTLIAITQPLLCQGQSISACLLAEGGVEKTLKANLIQVGGGFGAVVSSWT